MSDTLTKDQERGLAALLDTLIPPSQDGRLPGAGELGLGTELAARDDLRPLLTGGLATLDAKAGGDGFAALDAGARAEVLHAHADADPAFVPSLLFHLYSAYYQQPRVVAGLGFEHRPPYPQGYAMDPTDTSRLDAMRRRPPLYREV